MRTKRIEIWKYVRTGTFLAYAAKDFAIRNSLRTPWLTLSPFRRDSPSTFQVAAVYKEFDSLVYLACTSSRHIRESCIVILSRVVNRKVLIENIHRMWFKKHPTCSSYFLQSNPDVLLWPPWDWNVDLSIFSNKPFVWFVTSQSDEVKPLQTGSPESSELLDLITYNSSYTPAQRTVCNLDHLHFICNRTNKTHLFCMNSICNWPSGNNFKLTGGFFYNHK